MECVPDHSYQFHEINNYLVIPFKINESTDTPFIEMDPDIHIYSNTHYALKHTMWLFHWRHILDKYRWKNQCKNTSSLFHFNVKSLPKHHDEL